MQIQNTLYIMNIASLEDQSQFDQWYQLMPDFRKQKIDAFKPHRSKLLSLGAGILLHKALEDIGITDYEVELGEHEKPYIKGHDDVFFNISHSGKKVVLGISDKEIGVDVEKIKHFKDSLVNYVFNDTDMTLAKELSAGEDPDKAYTKLWTAKESLMKHSGKGISLVPKSIRLSLRGEYIIADCDDYNCRELLLTGFEADEYEITVCSCYSDFVMKCV